MNFRQLKQLFKYANQNAEAISLMPDVNLSKSSLFIDILKCYFKYHVYAIQYKKEKFWKLSPEQRDEIAKKYREKNLKNEAWAKDYYENFRFLIKWTAYKYEATANMQKKRINAYRRRYDIGENCFIGHDVIIERHHYLWGSLKIGNNCTIAKHVYIDYSGELIIQDDVALANSVIIETHSHTSDVFSKEVAKKCAVPTSLIIGDCVNIGSRAVILDTCHSIGRGAKIGAGALVRADIPPYAIVVGNPAKIVGFVFSPDVLEEYEEEKYPLEERIPIDVYKTLFKKYYLDRLNTIKDFISI